MLSMVGSSPVAHDWARFGWDRATVPSPVRPECPMAMIPTGWSRSTEGAGVADGATEGGAVATLATGDAVAAAELAAPDGLDDELGPDAQALTRTSTPT